MVSLLSLVRAGLAWSVEQLLFSVHDMGNSFTRMKKTPKENKETSLFVSFSRQTVITCQPFGLSASAKWHISKMMSIVGLSAGTEVITKDWN